MIEEIDPCNSDIGDIGNIGKFKRCDLDRIMTNEKKKKKTTKINLRKYFARIYRIFLYAYMRKKGAKSVQQFYVKLFYKNLLPKKSV